MKLRKIITLLGMSALLTASCAGCGAKTQETTAPSVQPAANNSSQSTEQKTESNEKKTENTEQETESAKQDEKPAYIEDLEYTDTIRWFNAAFAVLIGINRQDYNIYGGVEKTPMMQLSVQQMLDNSWGITDHDTAEETLDWLMTEGHRIAYAADMEYLKEWGIEEVDREDWTDFVLECFVLEDEGAEIYANAYELYSENGLSAFAAWDYSRAMSTAAYCYIGGYYTLEEALDYSLEAAKEAQEMFSSWDEFVDSYLLGYECWAEESGEDRRMVYETQKVADDSPYNIDWNLTFEKTW